MSGPGKPEKEDSPAEGSREVVERELKRDSNSDPKKKQPQEPPDPSSRKNAAR